MLTDVEVRMAEWIDEDISIRNSPRWLAGQATSEEIARVDQLWRNLDDPRAALEAERQAEAAPIWADRKAQAERAWARSTQEAENKGLTAEHAARVARSRTAAIERAQQRRHAEKAERRATRARRRQARIARRHNKPRGVAWAVGMGVIALVGVYVLVGLAGLIGTAMHTETGASPEPRVGSMTQGDRGEITAKYPDERARDDVARIRSLTQAGWTASSTQQCGDSERVGEAWYNPPVCQRPQ